MSRPDGFARVPAELLRLVKAQAAVMGISIRAAVEEALRAWLARQERRTKKVA